LQECFGDAIHEAIHCSVNPASLPYPAAGRIGGHEKLDPQSGYQSSAAHKTNVAC
jgi:hypothetical protein